MKELILCVFGIYVIAQRFYIGASINKERKKGKERRRELTKRRSYRFDNDSEENYRNRDR